MGVRYIRFVEDKDPFDLVTALRSQVDANAERLRRTREMVEVMTQHLDHSTTPPRRRKKNKT
jgi:hypothetical protein